MFRDAFFAQSASPTIEKVATTAGEAYVRSMSVGEKDTFDKAIVKDPSVSFRARLIVMCVCDCHGAPAFQTGDVHRIADFPLALVEPLVDAAIRVNKLSPKDLEALEKNCNGQSDSSSTV